LIDKQVQIDARLKFLAAAESFLKPITGIVLLQLPYIQKTARYLTWNGTHRMHTNTTTLCQWHGP
jgi:hypothetical protein